MTYDTRTYIYLPYDPLPEPVWIVVDQTDQE
jgi:hypothetical protein